jgi:myo-inositol 2-dehydrogenase/D-chiro-inositol 1-dehydrogenase/scyllo-inositol 2-dehydrogenase (NAD+)
MAGDRLGMCVIGCGRAGMIHARNIAGQIPDAEVVALADDSAEALSQASAELPGARPYAEYADAIADGRVNAAVIATPTVLHEQIALTAARAGKHVFLEKPMALTTAECDRINQAVAAAGVKLQIGFMRRFDEGFLRARRLLDGGDLGRVMLVKSTGRGPGGAKPASWKMDSTYSSFAASVNVRLRSSPLFQMSTGSTPMVGGRLPWNDLGVHVAPAPPMDIRSNRAA